MCFVLDLKVTILQGLWARTNPAGSCCSLTFPPANTRLGQVSPTQRNVITGLMVLREHCCIVCPLQHCSLSSIRPDRA